MYDIQVIIISTSQKFPSCWIIDIKYRTCICGIKYRTCICGETLTREFKIIYILFFDAFSHDSHNHNLFFRCVKIKFASVITNEDTSVEVG